MGCGRLWAHFISLFGQAVFLFLFGCVTKDTGGWPLALAALIVFAIFVNMAEGTSYGIVPYMIPTELAIVSAVVGAGGTLGAVIATWSFYKNFDTFTSLKLHAAYVAFWALTCYLMKWNHLGSMFGNPPEPATAEAATEAKGSQKEDANSESQGGPQNSDLPTDMPADKQDILDLRNEIVGLRDDLGLTKVS